MKNTNPLTPIHDRVLLEVFLGEDADSIEGGVIIPASAKKQLKEASRKFRWCKVTAVGASCLQVKVGQQALVFEVEVTLLVVQGDCVLNFVREGQIIAVRDAQLEETVP